MTHLHQNLLLRFPELPRKINAQFSGNRPLCLNARPTLLTRFKALEIGSFEFQVVSIAPQTVE